MDDILENTVLQDEIPLPNTVQRTIVQVENLRWADNMHVQVRADILWAELAPLGFQPFSTPNPADTEHGQLFWDNAMAGVYGPIGEYIAPVPNPAVMALTAEKFYVMLENMEKLVAFDDAVNALTPFSLKKACKQQFDNSPSFTWDMTVMQTVAPIVFGELWQELLHDPWLEAYYGA